MHRRNVESQFFITMERKDPFPADVKMQYSILLVKEDAGTLTLEFQPFSEEKGFPADTHILYLVLEGKDATIHF